MKPNHVLREKPRACLLGVPGNQGLTPTLVNILYDQSTTSRSRSIFMKMFQVGLKVDEFHLSPSGCFSLTSKAFGFLALMERIITESSGMHRLILSTSDLWAGLFTGSWAPKAPLQKHFLACRSSSGIVLTTSFFPTGLCTTHADDQCCSGCKMFNLSTANACCLASTPHNPKLSSNREANPNTPKVSIN